MRKRFYSDPALRKYVPEFEAATPKNAPLPERVKKGRPVKTKSKFDALASKLAQEPGVTNPRGLAASIGAKKYSRPVMQKAAASGTPAAKVRMK